MLANRLNNISADVFGVAGTKCSCEVHHRL